MEKGSFISRLFTLIGLVLLQVLFLNRINLFGYVTPLFYIWMIARFDSSMSRTSILLWAFFLGLSIDIFSGTPGLNAAAATLVAMFQPGIVKLFVPLDRHDVLLPCSASMGGRQFASYRLLYSAQHSAGRLDRTCAEGSIQHPAHIPLYAGSGIRYRPFCSQTLT